jgi:hypothetical protein
MAHSGLVEGMEMSKTGGTFVAQLKEVTQTA